MSIDSEFSIILHAEILTEIFSRTPAKTVGRLRCLSKTWQTILSTSHFIKLHLSRNTNQESLIILTQSNLHTIKPLLFENLRELDIGKGTWFWLLCSCNGLVLLQNHEMDMFLVNPTTLEMFKLPYIDNGWSGLGFGYDSLSHDYKILTFRRHSNSVGMTKVDMYSVKLGVWRSINNSLIYFLFGIGVYINGCLNWISVSRKSGVLFTLLSFNLATEVFRDIDVPTNSCGLRPCLSHGRSTLFAHGRSLCALLSFDNTTDEIWMSKEYGEVNSWTKLATFDENGMWFLYTPLWMGKNIIVFIACDEEIEGATMIEYNWQDGTMKKVVVNKEVKSFRGGLSFVDSLVSLREFTTAS